MNRKKKSPNKINGNSSYSNYECRMSYIVEMERIINKSAFLMKIYDEKHGPVPTIIHNDELDNVEKIQMLNAKLSAKLPDVKKACSRKTNKKENIENDRKPQLAKRMEQTASSTLEGYSELNSEHGNKQEEEKEQSRESKNETSSETENKENAGKSQGTTESESEPEDQEDGKKESEGKSDQENEKEWHEEENAVSNSEPNKNETDIKQVNEKVQFNSFCDSVSIKEDRKRMEIGIQTNSQDFVDCYPLRITVKTGDNNFKNSAKKGGKKNSTNKLIYLRLNNDAKILLNDLKLVDKKSNRKSNLLFGDQSVHSFLLNSSVPIDDIKTISVTLVAKALWFLECISIMDTSTKSELLFPCRRWIGRNSSDGLSEIKLGYTPPLIQSALFGKSIHEAILTYDIDRVNELLGFYPNIINFEDSNGLKAIHLVAKDLPDTKQSWKILQLLLQAKIDLKSPTSEGQLPLHLAAMHGNVWFLEFLLHNKFDCSDLEITDRDGFTAVELARKNNRHKVVKLLEDYQQNPVMTMPPNSPSNFVFNQTIREVSQESEENRQYRNRGGEAHVQQKSTESTEETKERVVNDEYHTIPNEKSLPDTYAPEKEEQEIMLSPTNSESFRVDSGDKQEEPSRFTNAVGTLESNPVKETETNAESPKRNSELTTVQVKETDLKETNENETERSSSSSVTSSSQSHETSVEDKDEGEAEEINSKSIAAEGNEYEINDILKTEAPILKNDEERDPPKVTRPVTASVRGKDKPKGQESTSSSSRSSSSSSSVQSANQIDETSTHVENNAENDPQEIPKLEINNSRRSSIRSNEIAENQDILLSSSSDSTIRDDDKTVDNADTQLGEITQEVDKVEDQSIKEGDIPDENVKKIDESPNQNKPDQIQSSDDDEDDDGAVTDSISTASSSNHQSQRDKETDSQNIKKRPRISFKNREMDERGS